jgi:hypothetical protein
MDWKIYKATESFIYRDRVEKVLVIAPQCEDTQYPLLFLQGLTSEKGLLGLLEPLYFLLS